jgi:hypothetical protein
VESEATKNMRQLLYEDFHDFTFKSRSIILEGYAICKELLRSTKMLIRTPEAVVNSGVHIGIISNKA